jgi:hypothetical protein
MAAPAGKDLNRAGTLLQSAEDGDCITQFSHPRLVAMG